ncbi:MAG TPA: tRNA 2-thiouridine(34) synthase MnmA [Acidimicrobiia bacterium]|nr:tRNA 2-thiouridine(34) synthase MnmA [Acidimicrobiia bacterium]
MRVLVAMSGGVDSSVAAARLKAAGHDVTGVTLKLWGGESDSGCCSVADVEDARRVAAQLGIPHYTFNFSDDFSASVVDPYVEAHAAGLTPNPCVECNRSIKFGRLLERAEATGFDAVATGHHARVVVSPAGDGTRRHELARGHDGGKDQSYVLYMLSEADLARLRLPVGEMTKAEVRAEAAALGLRTAAKPESMEVCFITRGGRERFLAERGVLRPGAVVDPSGRAVGRHEGAALFTVGQRRGLGVAAGERRYVLDVDAARAAVTVGPYEDLLRDEVQVDGLRFVAGAPPSPSDWLLVEVRAHGTPFDGRLDATGSWSGVVRFARPQPRVAPGQVVALYRGDVLLGGGLAR